MIQFEAWPKTPRLFRESMVITEKIDGTNSAVGVIERPAGSVVTEEWGDACLVARPEADYLVYAQSRNRLITPLRMGGKGADNYNFAEWVWKNADELARVLGPGLHFGEWWGHGIGRGYGMAQGERYFSLFNTSRWKHLAIPEARADVQPPEGLRVVPVLHVFTLDTKVIREALGALKITGSYAAPGYMNPEGVCVYLPAARATFKVTFDDTHKGVLREHKLDAEALAEIGA